MAYQKMNNEEFMKKVAEMSNDPSVEFFILLHDGWFTFTTAGGDFKRQATSQQGNMIYYSKGVMETDSGERNNMLVKGIPVPYNYWLKLKPETKYRARAQKGYIQEMQEV